MKIEIVYDNYTSGENFSAGWGFSALIDKKILFDTGEDGASLVHNLSEFGVSPGDLQGVVISHEHWDHTGGLWDILEMKRGITVYICPGFSKEFREKVVSAGGVPAGDGSFQEIDRGIFVTGEIPSTYKGMAMPEQALVIKGKKGLTLLTGCSHPGIITMIEKAHTLFPGHSLHLVAGGFHLMAENEEYVRKIAGEMIELGVKNAAPTHCTGDGAIEVFKEIYGPGFVEAAAGAVVSI